MKNAPPSHAGFLGNHTLLKRRIARLERALADSRRAEAKLRCSEARFRFLTENMADIAFVVDLDLRTTYVSPSIERVLGFTPAERLAQPVEQQIPPRSLRLVAETFTEERERDKNADPQRSRTLIIDYYHRNGSLRTLETNLRGLRDRHGKLTGFFGLSRDISERIRIEAALWDSERRYRRLSTVDDLTQLYNSRHFYERLAAEIGRADSTGQPLTLLLLDLDDFKRYNDAFGHLEGDRLLRRMGQLIRQSLRQTDSAYRYGGEEFTILLPATGSAEGVVTAERILRALREERFLPQPEREVRMTVSIGLAQHRPQEEMEAFVQRVDRLMYRGKSNGKNTVVCDAAPTEPPGP